jgi:hypothetical protein
VTYLPTRNATPPGRCVGSAYSTAAARVSQFKLKHGLARADGSRHPDFGLWKRMRQRCTDPNCDDYADYGGRGITVCDRWRDSFEAFLEDMGPRPSKRHSIDRVDGTKGYEPGNCRWALPTTQAQNRRGVVLTPEKAAEIRTRRAAGESYSAIADAVGVTRSQVNHVLNDGAWPQATAAGPSRQAG